MPENGFTDIMKLDSFEGRICPNYYNSDLYLSGSNDTDHIQSRLILSITECKPTNVTKCKSF